MPNSKSRTVYIRELYKKQTGERFVQVNNMSDENLQKRLAIVQIKLDNPDITLQALGDKFNLTRERIRQVLISEGFITHRKPKTQDCKYCSKSFIVIEHQKNKLSIAYCSQRCKEDAHRVYLNCATCEKQYFLGSSEYRGRKRYKEHGNNYCSVKCRGIGTSKTLKKRKDAGVGVGFEWGWGRSKDGISTKRKEAIAKECGISLNYLYHMIRGMHNWRVDVYEAYMKVKNSIN